MAELSPDRKLFGSTLLKVLLFVAVSGAFIWLVIPTALSNPSFAAMFAAAICGCLTVMAIVWWRRVSA
jgi:hypothetical protein